MNETTKQRRQKKDSMIEKVTTSSRKRVITLDKAEAYTFTGKVKNGSRLFIACPQVTLFIATFRKLRAVSKGKNHLRPLQGRQVRPKGAQLITKGNMCFLLCTLKHAQARAGSNVETYEKLAKQMTEQGTSTTGATSSSCVYSRIIGQPWCIDGVPRVVI